MLLANFRFDIRDHHTYIYKYLILTDFRPTNHEIYSPPDFRAIRYIIVSVLP